MHFCALRWPSWLGRQTHRVLRRKKRAHHLRHLEVVGSDPTRSIRTPLFTCSRLPLYIGWPETLFCMPSTTVTAETFGCIKSEYADAAINRGLTTGQINNRDLQLIREYLAEKRATAGINSPVATKPAAPSYAGDILFHPSKTSHRLDLLRHRIATVRPPYKGTAVQTEYHR